MSATSASSRGAKRKPKFEIKLESPSIGQSLSTTFKDRRLRVTEDKLSVVSAGSLGYSSICASHSASCGKWYFEATVEELGEDSFFRLGFSTRRTRFDAPIGSDCFSFAVRSKDGKRVTQGRCFEYGTSQPMGVGDVIGCELELPSNSPLSPTMRSGLLACDPNLLCDPENVNREIELCGEPSSIRFFRNGSSLGTAFVNLVAGEYHPAVSLMGKVRIRFNFGSSEEFLSQKKIDPQTKPASEMYVAPELKRPRRRPANFIPRGLTSLVRN